MNDDTDNRWRELIAKSVASANAELFRDLVAQAIREAITKYDVREIVNAAIKPIANQIAVELMKDETVITMMKDKVKSELLKTINNRY